MNTEKKIKDYVGLYLRELENKVIKLTSKNKELTKRIENLNIENEELNIENEKLTEINEDMEEAIRIALTMTIKNQSKEDIIKVLELNQNAINHFSIMTE